MQLAQEHQGRIDLLLTDVVMPGMSGAELAASLGTLRPNAKVLFMSGYTGDVMVRPGILADEAALIRKPFSPAALFHKVWEILSA